MSASAPASVSHPAAPAPAPAVAILTPPGCGGVSVLALAGEGSADVLARVFRPRPGARAGPRPAGGPAPSDTARGGALPRPAPDASARPQGLARPAPGALGLGWLEDGAGPIDEVIVARLDVSSFEIGCHGGAGVARRAHDTLVAAGARAGSPAELEALSCPTADATAAEARELILLATTELAARVLAGALDGRLSRAAEALAEGVLACSEPGASKVGRAQLLADLAALEATAPFGLACSEPPAVALVGRPNAGKSTLFNALLGRDRAIVSPEPGTTRDVIDETAALEGLPVRLLDLAGLRASEDPIEREGVSRGERHAREASLRLLVLDATETPLEPALRLLDEQARLPGRALVVLTKSDLATSDLATSDLAKSGLTKSDVATSDLAGLDASAAASLPRLRVSARTGEGLDALVLAIVEALAGTRDLEPLAAGPVLVTRRQRDLVSRAHAALAQGAFAEAETLLRQIQTPHTGRRP